MDSKIILAILIVALIGIVAATYQNETSNVIDTLSNVAVEEENPEGATDILDSNIGSDSDDSVKIDEDVVKSDNTAPKKAANKKTTTNTNSANNNNNNNNNGRSNSNNPTSNSNSSSNPSNNNNNPSNTNNSIKPNNTNSSTSQSNTTTYKISSSTAKDIATRNLPEQYSKAVASNPKLYNGYYEVTFYMDGKSIGYYEIDANTGAITGGAFKDEVPSPDN